MNTVKENLIAAKALIDTPEKWGDINGIVLAVSLAVPSTQERAEVVKALRATGVDRNNPLPMILAAFDRAIAACPDP